MLRKISSLVRGWLLKQKHGTQAHQGFERLTVKYLGRMLHVVVDVEIDQHGTDAVKRGAVVPVHQCGKRRWLRQVIVRAPGSAPLPK